MSRALARVLSATESKENEAETEYLDCGTRDHAEDNRAAGKMQRFMGETVTGIENSSDMMVVTFPFLYLLEHQHLLHLYRYHNSYVCMKDCLWEPGECVFKAYIDIIKTTQNVIQGLKTSVSALAVLRCADNTF